MITGNLHLGMTLHADQHMHAVIIWQCPLGRTLMSMHMKVLRLHQDFVTILSCNLLRHNFVDRSEAEIGRRERQIEM